MRRQRIERGGIGDFPAIEADALAGIGIDDQALLAVIHAKRARAAALVDELHAEKARGVGRPLVDITGADPDIPERLKLHRVSSTFCTLSGRREPVNLGPLGSQFLSGA